MKIMGVAVLVAMTTVVASAGEANRYVALRADVTALPADAAFVGDVLVDRAKERTAFAPTGRTLSVAYALDAALTGETYRVSVRGDRASIRAGRLRGLLFGTGKLLRSIEWRADSFSVPEGERTICPTKPIRIAYYARHFYNWYHMATAADLVRYTQDLALWGVNCVNCQLVFPVVDLKNAWGDDVKRYEAVSGRFADALARMDLGIVGGGGGNQAPDKTDPALRGEPNKDPKRGNMGFNVCPAKPGGLEFLLKQHRSYLDKSKGIRFEWLSHWPYDEGGCDCAICRPWGGNGYLKLCKTFAAQNALVYPKAKSLVSTWTFHDDEYELLYKYLATDESKWIGALNIDSHGDFPKYPLTHKLPRDIPIVTFPEISMWGREPWGGFGAIAMPARFERLFRQCERVVSGFMFYSEGLSEDLNKVVVTQLYDNPTRHWQDIIREYCRWEFPGVDPDRFVELVTHLENMHALPNFQKRTVGAQEVGRGADPVFADFEARCRYCLEEATKAEALSAELEKSLVPSRRACWRWRHIRLRTIIDKEIFAARKWNTPVADAAYRELVKIYNAKRTYSWLRPPIKDKK